MSTTQAPIAHSSTAVPSPPQTPDSDPPTPFFGFLVTFLSIFSAFITFTAVWERLVFRRFAIDPVLALGAPPHPPQLHRPKMWNIWVIPDKQPHPWLGIKPVAAQKCDYPPSSSRTTQTEQTTSFRIPRLLNQLPPEITYLFRPLAPPLPSTSDALVSQVELPHGSDIQVSLLIAMPQAPRSTRERMHENHPVFHEVVFATTNVVYHDPAPTCT
ncbi:hypothetical protein OG21DRAFT_628639 [Imleria badia]|nr:hypothetical protein OG21DRAFT_628639 [Imleria badia]